MKDWVVELWRFMRGRPDHPIYRRELAGWSYIRAWRGMRRGCLPIIAVMFFLSTCLCGGMLTLPFGLSAAAASPADDTLAVLTITVIIALGIGILVGESWLRFFTTLAGLVLASTTISAEVEAETLPLLRLTPIPPREIVMAKFGAVMQQLQLPMRILVLIRVLLLVGTALVLAAGALIAFILFRAELQELWAEVAALIPPVASPAAMGLTIILYLIAGVTSVIAIIAWIVFVVIQPLLEVFLFVALGTFASSLAKTRGSGLVTAGGILLGWWAASYFFSQFASIVVQILMLPLMAVPSMPVWMQDVLLNAGLAIIAGALATIVSVVIFGGGHVLIASGLLRWAIGRTGHLPFGA